MCCHSRALNLTDNYWTWILIIPDGQNVSVINFMAKDAGQGEKLRISTMDKTITSRTGTEIQ